VPALNWLLQTETKSELSLRLTVEALGRIGPAAKPAVTRLNQLLNDEREDMLWVKCESAIALARIGPAAKGAVPSLIKVLTSSKNGNSLRLAAITAVGAIHSDAQSAVPTLLCVIRDPKEAPNLRIEAIRALRPFGYLAVEGLPALVAISTSQWDTIAYPQDAAESIFLILDSSVMHFDDLTRKDRRNLDRMLKQFKPRLVELDGIVPSKTLNGIQSLAARIAVLVVQQNPLPNKYAAWIKETLTYVGIALPGIGIVILLLMGNLPVRVLLRLHIPISASTAPPVALLKFFFELIPANIAYNSSCNRRWVNLVLPEVKERNRMPDLNECPHYAFGLNEHPLRPLCQFSPEEIRTDFSNMRVRLLITGPQNATTLLANMICHWAASANHPPQGQGPFIPVRVHMLDIVNSAASSTLSSIGTQLNDVIPRFSNLPPMFVRRLLEQGHILLVCGLHSAHPPAGAGAEVLRDRVDSLFSEVGIRNLIVLSHIVPADMETYRHIRTSVSQVVSKIGI
jgi:hypothetical protein